MNTYHMRGTCGKYKGTPSFHIHLGLKKPVGENNADILGSLGWEAGTCCIQVPCPKCAGGVGGAETDKACKGSVGAVTDGDWTAFGDECDTEDERKTGTDNEPSRPSCWIRIGHENQRLRQIELGVAP